MMLGKGIIIIILLALSGQSALIAARGKNESRKIKQKGQPALVKNSAGSESSLIRLTKAYRTNLEKMFIFHAAQEFKASELEEERQHLYAQGALSKEALQESMRTHLEEKLKLNGIRRELEEIDILISEAEAFDSLINSSGKYSIRSTLVRYSGFNSWNIQDIGRVRRFFSEKFGRQLPVSALGQTAIHDRLGFAHYNSVDVALHPDSFEGQSLMAYLRSSGIPFIAFRQAVPGSATGAHIHIGKPSARY
jgi:hypothetical protein